jgi:hypothetical protein
VCCQMSEKGSAPFGRREAPFTVASGWELGGGQSCSPQAPGATVALTMFRNMGAHHSPLLGGTAGCARAAASDLVTFGRKLDRRFGVVFACGWLAGACAHATVTGGHASN